MFEVIRIGLKTVALVFVVVTLTSGMTSPELFLLSMFVLLSIGVFLQLRELYYKYFALQSVVHLSRYLTTCLSNHKFS